MPHGKRRFGKGPPRALAIPAGITTEYADGMMYAASPALARPRAEATNIVKLFDRVLNPREIRRRLGLNQEQFWTQIGVTQSGGSRYESGREMPKPVRELLRLVHVEQIDLSQVKRVDFEIISYLKNSHPDLYRSLWRAVRSQHRTGNATDLVAHNIPAAGPGDEDADHILPVDAIPSGGQPA